MIKKWVLIKLYSFAPISIPDAQTQRIFNDSIKNSFTLSFDSWTNYRMVARTSEYQLDTGSAVKVDSPNYLKAEHQTAARFGVTNKANIVSVFDHVDVRKYHVNIDGVRHTKDSVNINYGTKEYLDRYKDLIIFYEEYAKVPRIKPLIITYNIYCYEIFLSNSSN